MLACEGMVIDCAGGHPEQMRLVIATDKDTFVIASLSLFPCSDAFDLSGNEEDYHWERTCQDESYKL